jgi:cytochrome b involved in lipid metabolism
VLLEKAGKEATADFEDVGHSTDAKESLKNYLVGTIALADQLEYGKKKKDKSQCQYVSLA